MKKSVYAWGAGAVTSLVVATSASAYQYEATGLYTDFDDLNDSALSIGGASHFMPVDTSGLPLAEAAFLRRSSEVNLRYTTFDDADIDQIGIGGEAYMQNYYLAAGLTRTEFGNTDSDEISIEVGFFPADGVRISLGYDDDDGGDSELSLNAKLVEQMSGESAYNVEARIAQADDPADTVSYAIDWDLYVSRVLSFGLGYADTDRSGSNEEIELRASMFVIPDLGLHIAYTTQDTGAGAVGDRITLGVTGRF